MTGLKFSETKTKKREGKLTKDYWKAGINKQKGFRKGDVRKREFWDGDKRSEKRDQYELRHYFLAIP